MPKGKGTYGSKKGRPPMEYGQVKKPKMTDKKINLDYKRKQTREEIKEREERIQRRLREDAKKRAGAKPQMNKLMKHHGPYQMKPGSKQINSPSIFKANEPAMIFKNNMPKMMVDTEKLSAGKRKLVEGVAKADMKPKKYHK